MQRRLPVKINEKDLIPLGKCTLRNGSCTVSGLLMGQVNLNIDTGIVQGYIKVNDILDCQGLLIPYTNVTEECYLKNIDDVPNTYVASNKMSGIKVDFDRFTFHNLVINRYRDSMTLFKFIARATISDIKKFETLIKGGSDGQGTTRSLKAKN